MRIKLKTLSILYFLTNLLISGCGFQDSSNSLKYTRQPTSFKQASNLLAEMYSSKDARQKNELTLAAVEKYLEANLTQKANKLLNNIDQHSLDQELNTKFHLLKAKVYLNNNDSKHALAELDELPSAAQDLKEQYYQEKKIISINAIDKINSNNQEKNYYQDSQENQNTEDEEDIIYYTDTDKELALRVEIDNKLKNNSELAERNKQNIWNKLIKQDRKTIEKLIDKTKNSKLASLDDNENYDYGKILERKNNQQILLGWLELAQITRLNGNIQDQEYFEKIRNWQNKYSNHPAINYIVNTNNTFLVPENQNRPVNKVAVLLPLTGKLAPAAKAIKQGMLTAYYNDTNQNKPELIFIDTKNQAEKIPQYYNEAISNQADLIIGPLNKTEVNSLIENIKPKVPTIALNYSNDEYLTYSPANLYQFGISGEDEAEQAANKIWQNDLKNTLLIVDQNTWGKRVSEAFIKNFTALGGNVANIAYLNTDTDFKKFIYQTLGVENSQKRKNTLQWIVGKKIAFQPRHRQDFDSIFLATSSIKAKQIKPILKFYYADNIPVVATSNILDYKYYKNNSNYKDLSGIQICDIPLLLHNNKNNKNIINQLKQTWPNDYENFIRLYALGLDAYQLSYDLNKLTQLPNMGILANTGHLVISKNQKISRLLPWAEIKDNGLEMVDVM